MLKRRGRSLVLILVLLAVLALVGCGGSETKVTGSEVVQNATAAMQDVTSSSTNLHVNLTYTGTKSGQPTTGSLDVVATTVKVDTANQKMYANPTITINVPPIVMSPTAQIYVIGADTYLQVTMPAQPSIGWAKESGDSASWANMASSQYQTQVLGAMAPGEPEKVKLGGVSCYMMTMTPNPTQLQAMLGESAGLITGTPSITVWVEQKTSLLKKVDMTVNMTVPQAMLADADLGLAAAMLPDSDLAVTLTLTADFSYSAQTITLPTEAASATLSFDQYLGQLMSGFSSYLG